jgi:hypothetical protein
MGSYPKKAPQAEPTCGEGTTPVAAPVPYHETRPGAKTSVALPALCGPNLNQFHNIVQ